MTTGCADRSPSLIVEPPGKLQLALTTLDDLEAHAQLVPRGGQPQGRIALTRGDDGRSFSGLLEAAPGAYTLEVVFSGASTVTPGRLFLGRWTSDAFTVSLGSLADAKFASPLDTIGRPEDEGDADQDGLGLLDELLWGTDPTRADTDMDGLLDGEDCSPRVNSRYKVIGTLEDCDGDGALRTNIPYRAGGTDCADEDPTIPREDTCGDGVDADCNPATCPEELVPDTPPMFREITPRRGSRAGCQSRLQIEVIDTDEIVAVSLISPTQIPLSLTRTATSTWTSAPIEESATMEGLPQGIQTFEILASDAAGNTATVDHPLDLVFEIPTVSTFTADDANAEMFDVQVIANAATSVAKIELLAAKRMGSGNYRHDEARSLGVVERSSTTFTVDRADFDDGTYALYPVVTDAIGNVLRPADTFIVFAEGGRSTAFASYRCLGSTTRVSLPVITFLVGSSNPFRPQSMGELRDEAISRAAMTDPNARLVSIFGQGIQPTGQVALDAASFVPRWVFTFYNPGDSTHLTVTWLTAAHGRMNPVIETMSNSSSNTTPINAAPRTLVDSPEVLRAYSNAAGCPALNGDEMDFIQYTNIDGEDVVGVFSAGNFWRATATAPVTEVIACR